MQNRPKIYLVGSGVISAVGGTAITTAAAVRADISQYQESPDHNKRLRPMKMALVPDAALPPLNEQLVLTEELTARQSRMLRMADPALKEALKSYPLHEPIPLLLAGPETLPHCPVPLQEHFLDDIMLQTGANIHRKNSRLLPTGRAGGLQAIKWVFEYFETTGKDYVLIGGVDSCLDRYLLGFLDSEDRILAEGVRDGFAPGEAAGFLLLASERVRSSLPLPHIGIYRPGIGSEPGHRYSHAPYRGDGLADAFRNAIDHAPGVRIKSVYASFNGESYGAKEFGVASTRNSHALEPKIEIEHPGDCFGDIGAAFGPVLISLIHYGFHRGFLNKPCLAYAASDGDLRGAVCIST